MSVLTGLGFWLFTALYGLDLSREWGVIAFVLNFIPFIGSFVATLLPTLFAAAQYESLASSVWIFIGLNIIQFVVGSYIEPRVAGRAVAVSWCCSRCSSGGCCGASPAPLSAFRY